MRPAYCGGRDMVGRVVTGERAARARYRSAGEHRRARASGVRNTGRAPSYHRDEARCMMAHQHVTPPEHHPALASFLVIAALIFLAWIAILIFGTIVQAHTLF